VLVALRAGQDFAGPVARLAQHIAAGENATWRALESLVARELIEARTLGFGSVSVHLTRAGRQVPLESLTKMRATIR
jgi:hypothetical protein